VVVVVDVDVVVVVVVDVGGDVVTGGTVEVVEVVGPVVVVVDVGVDVDVVGAGNVEVVDDDVVDDEATPGGGQSPAAVAVALAQTRAPAAISTTASVALRRATHTATAPVATSATATISRVEALVPVVGRHWSITPSELANGRPLSARAAADVNRALRHPRTLGDCQSA
jgi:hypothetical protein